MSPTTGWAKGIVGALPRRASTSFSSASASAPFWRRGRIQRGDHRPARRASSSTTSTSARRASRRGPARCRAATSRRSLLARELSLDPQGGDLQQADLRPRREDHDASSASGSATCAAEAAPRSSSPPTSTSCSRSATGSRCCREAASSGLLDNGPGAAAAHRASSWSAAAASRWRRPDAGAPQSRRAPAGAARPPLSRGRATSPSARSSR